MKPFRIEKVCSEMRHLISDVIRHELQDPRISSMTSITRVEVSRDLEWAKIYVSVYGEPGEKNKTLQALKHAAGFIQNRIGQDMKIRQSPHLNFFLDDSVNKSQEIMQLIDKSMRELQPKTSPQNPSTDENSEGDGA